RISRIWLRSLRENATAEFCAWAEIQEQTHLEPCRFQVVEQLCFVRFHEAARCLDLDKEAVFDEQVSAEFADDMVVEPDRNGRLPFDPQPALVQPDGQCTFVDAFQEAITQLVVRIEEGTDDLLADSAM